MTSQQYLCVLCSNAFASKWVTAGQLASYIAKLAGDDKELVCSNCYNDIMEYIKNESRGNEK